MQANVGFVAGILGEEAVASILAKSDTRLTTCDNFLMESLVVFKSFVTMNVVLPGSWRMP